MKRQMDYHQAANSLNRLVSGQTGYSIAVSRLFKVHKDDFIRLHATGMSIREMHAKLSPEMNNVSYFHFASELRKIVKEHQRQMALQEKQPPSPSFVDWVSKDKTGAGKAPSAPSNHTLHQDGQRDVKLPQSESEHPAQNTSSPKPRRYLEEQDAQTPAVSNVNSTKQGVLMAKPRDDASRSTLFPEVVYRLKADASSVTDRSVNSALDGTLYKDSGEYVRHRAVEVLEFLSPQEREAMRLDMSKQAIETSLDKSFLETLQTIANPKYRVTKVIEYDNGSTLWAHEKAVLAIQLGKVRSWAQFDQKERELDK